MMALLFSFLFLAVLIPHTGKIIANHSANPPTFTITDRPQEITMLICLLLVPLACIYFGVKKFRFLEFVGWLLLAGLFVIAINK